MAARSPFALPEDASWGSYLLLLLSVIVPILFQILVYPRPRRNGSLPAGVSVVQTRVPHYGHLWSLLFRSESFLQSLRDEYSESSSLTLYILGKHCTVITRPHLIYDAVKHIGDDLNVKDVMLKVLSSAFAYPAEASSHQSINPKSKGSSDEVDTSFLDLSLQVQDEMVKKICRNLEHALPDFVSFTTSIIDQATWERGSIISIDKSDDSVVVDFYTLLHAFITETLISYLVHPLDQIHYSPNAEISEDLRTLSSGLPLLILGYPRWVTMPSRRPAQAARSRIIYMLTSIFRILDHVKEGREVSSDSDWAGFADTVAEGPDGLSPLLRAVQTKMGACVTEARASITLATLVTLITRITNLTFWSLAHISSYSYHKHPGLRNDEIQADLREELAVTSTVGAQQPKSPFPGIMEPVRLSIDTTKLIRSPRSSKPAEVESPVSLLEASYMESVRLYDRSVGIAEVVRYVSADVGSGTKGKLEELLKANPNMPPSLRQGEYVLLPCAMHNLSSASWTASRMWLPQRHMNWHGDGRAEGEVLTGLGLDAIFCGGEDLVRRLTMALIGGFIAVWDVELLGEWVPVPKGSLTVTSPDRTVKGRIRRRSLA